ncbi:MAG: relaxase/mobilization nuclease domain-containing protein [Eubacteriales bacterium]
MATVTFINTKTQTKARMKQAMDYVTQDAKVSHDGRKLVSAFNCMAESAFQDFLSTKKLYGKEDGRQFYHFVQSFSPDEDITPELAHEVALRLAEFYKDYEVLVATHVDRDHVHSHFIVNAVSFENGKKLHQNGNTIKELRKFSDDLCREFGLSVCQPKQEKTEPVSGKEYHSAVRGDSWKIKLVSTIDLCMAKAKSKKHFKKLMFDQGYGVKWEENRKYITYFTPEGQRCRCNKLHDKRYSKEMMERELRIREEIVARRTEKTEPTRATDGTTSTTGQRATDTTVDTDGRGLGRNSQQPDGTVEQAREHPKQNPEQPPDHNDGVEPDFHKETSGGTDKTGGEDSEDTRTGWEKEREEVFSSKTHSTRSATRVSRADDGIGVQLLGDLVQLGKGLESVGEEPYQEPIEDCTNNPQAKHIDKKRLQKIKTLKDKGMTQSM